MIIFADEKLSVKKLVGEALHQGSNKANTIQFVAPIDSNATLKVAFELPNGVPTRQYLLESVGYYDHYYMWSVDVPYAITQIPGKVKCQIVASIGKQTIGSSAVDFVVSEGVDYQNQDLEDDQYSEIIGYINETKIGVANKVSVNYNEMLLIESPQSTYSAECYKAVYSFNLIAGNITTTSGYYVYNYDEETGTGEYVEATGAVDLDTNYYSRVISGYEKVTLPDDYVEGVNYYTISKQQSIYNDNNGLYFYIVENGKTKTMRISGDKITIDNQEIITEDKLSAENVAYDDIDTTLGATTVQEAIKKVDQKVDAIDVSEQIQFVSLGLLSISSEAWSAVQYMFVEVDLETADGKTYYVFDDELKEYVAVVLTVENFNEEATYFKREEYYYFDFTHRLLTNSITQDLMLTPDDDTNALLDVENIKIFPFVEMGGTSGNAFGRIKINKIPSRTISFANVTLYGTGIANEATGLKASQIDFEPVDDIESISVQGAVTEINSKFETRVTDCEDNIETIENTLAGIQATKTVDAYIVTGGSTYSSLWLQDENENIFNTGDGTLNQYDNYYIKTPDTDYTGNTYTWSGSNYVKVAGNLTLGTGSTQAYPGNQGQTNRTTLNNHTNQLTNLAQRVTTAESDIDTLETGVNTANISATTNAGLISAIQILLGAGNLQTTNQTIKGAINELKANAFIPTFAQYNNRATGKNGSMYHYFTVITLGEWRCIFGKVDALDANGNVNVSWGSAMFQSSTFANNNGYIIVPGFTIQTRNDNRGMDEPTHIKSISTDGFIFYNSNGYTTTGTYVAFGKKV